MNHLASKTIAIQMKEWEHLGPLPGSVLAGWSFGDDIQARRVAEELTRSGQLEIRELISGLEITTSQYVGSLQLGSLQITVIPKLQGKSLINLLRYAYHLRNLELFEEAKLPTQGGEFQDLLIHQLANESLELIERGLQRQPERIDENLTSPRGRINFTELAHQAGLVRDTLPCRHYLRLENNLLNQTLLAGLVMAVGLTNDLGLRGQLRRSIRVLEQTVQRVPLSANLIQNARHHLNRLTWAYRASLTLIELLFEAQGVTLQAEQRQLKLTGFLFDMNRFFQALVARFLSENLTEHRVQEEFRLQRMLAYNPAHNPKHRRAPSPRPDFAILDNKRAVALLDTKYRDLWENELPRNMLYQLALYAFSQERPGKATILYPTLHPHAREAWVDITHPVLGEPLARVILHPIHLPTFEKLIYTGSQAERETYAHQIVFGEVI